MKFFLSNPEDIFLATSLVKKNDGNILHFILEDDLYKFCSCSSFNVTALKVKFIKPEMLQILNQ